MRALRESGQAENTLTMFLSDNGMALPFSKTNCYLHSTRTPWIVIWPGKIEPGTVDNRHFISGIDFMPTALDAAGVPQPEGMDGFSFLPILLGQQQAGQRTDQRGDLPVQPTEHAEDDGGRHDYHQAADDRCLEKGDCVFHGAPLECDHFSRIAAPFISQKGA